MQALKTLYPYFYRYKYRLILGLFITISARIFSIFVPTSVGSSIDIITQYINGNTLRIGDLKTVLFENILIIISSICMYAFFTFLMRQTFIVVSRHIEFDLKNVIFSHYLRLSNNFYKNNRTGDLMNRITEDVSKVRMFIGPAVMYSVNTLTLFIIVIGYMFQTAPRLTLYTLLPLPILSILIYRLSTLIHKKSKAVQENLSKLTSFAQETFSGISLIKIHNHTAQSVLGFTAIANDNQTKNIALAKLQALFFPLMILLIGCSNFLVIYIGGKQYISGVIQDFGVLVEFIFFVNLLTWPVATVGWVSSIVQQAEASQARILEFLKVKPEIQSATTAEEKKISGHIVCNNVQLTYADTGITALDKLNLEIQAGQTIGILGKTGSGKSSIFDLLGRLYLPTAGTLLIDGVSIADIGLSNLRKAIAFVPQDAFLFSETIKENIKFGKEGASEAEVVQAAKQALVHHNIMDFRKGYDTVLGERGITLSGGQKQRVSIARAWIKEASIVLLDDCLSAVDTETEEKILHNLKQYTQGKTTLITSHRVATVQHADCIFVLDKGKIIQKGKHEQLQKAQGFYRELYLKQRKSDPKKN